MHAFIGEHHEQGGVDGIGAGAQDLALRAALAAFGEEGCGITGIDIFGPGSQGLAFGQGCAGAGEQIADAAHGDQFLAVHAVLEWREQVPAALDGGGQEAGAALQRHEAGQGAAGAKRPCALDHAIAVITNEDEASADDAEQEQRECAGAQPTYGGGALKKRNEHGRGFREAPLSEGARKRRRSARLAQSLRKRSGRAPAGY